MFFLRIYIVIFCISSLCACSPTKHDKALTLYQQAIEAKNLNNLLTALTTLAQLDPTQYKTELDKIKTVNTQLQQAKKALDGGNDYLAYISIHDAYRAFPTTQSKQILLITGKKMLPILRADSAVKKSSEKLPSTLQKIVLAYGESAISEWNLIDVNKLVVDMNESIGSLNNALTIIQDINSKISNPEFAVWAKSIETQKNTIILIKNHLINTAFAQSIQQLKHHNQTLTAKTGDLLSLVRENDAVQGVQPLFFKAEQEYQPYLTVIENLSLANTVKHRNQHSEWYVHWHQLEKDTLTIPEPLNNYLIKDKQRLKQFSAYLEKEQESLRALTTLPQTIKNNVITPLKIQRLITKLKKDKTLISYGAAKILRNENI